MRRSRKSTVQGKSSPDNTSTIYLSNALKIYFAGIYEVELGASQTVTKETSYYGVPGGRVIMRVLASPTVGSGVDDMSVQTVYYVMTDRCTSSAQTHSTQTATWSASLELSKNLR